MVNIKKITLKEIEKRHTEIWKKENELKTFIKQNDKTLKDKRAEIELMDRERTDLILEYIRQNPDKMKEDRIYFDIIIKGPVR